jgi:hypothetical protein
VQRTPQTGAVSASEGGLVPGGAGPASMTATPCTWPSSAVSAGPALDGQISRSRHRSQHLTGLRGSSVRCAIDCLTASISFHCASISCHCSLKERCTAACHPLGVKMFSYRWVKNDERDAADLADLLRMGRLPEAWIAPPATRELRQLVRHRAKLVALRSSVKCQIHAVLAGCGVQVPMSDLFGLGGQQLLQRVELPPACRARVGSTTRVLQCLDFEIEVFTNLITGRLRGHRGYTAIQAIPGVGAILGAVFVAEIGDVHRFPGPNQLTSWAGMTPQHHESDTKVHRGRITKMGCGGRRPAADVRPTVSNWGGCRVSGGWNRYSSIPVDI